MVLYLRNIFKPNQCIIGWEVIPQVKVLTLYIAHAMSIVHIVGIWLTCMCTSKFISLCAKLQATKGCMYNLLTKSKMK